MGMGTRTAERIVAEVEAAAASGHDGSVFEWARVATPEERESYFDALVKIMRNCADRLETIVEVRRRARD